MQYQEVLEVRGGEEALEVLNDREPVALLGGATAREAQQKQLASRVLELRALQLGAQDAPVERTIHETQHLYGI